jgi:1-phosphatidylinositol-4-phosphate 5-kinase
VNRTTNGRASSVSGLSNSSGGDGKYDKICIWESDGDITCDIVDGPALGDEAVSVRRSFRTDGGGDDRVLLPSSPAPHITQWVPPREAKRQGETIAKGHKHYELMLNLQLGIRCVEFVCLQCLKLSGWAAVGFEHATLTSHNGRIHIESC